MIKCFQIKTFINFALMHSITIHPKNKKIERLVLTFLKALKVEYTDHSKIDPLFTKREIINNLKESVDFMKAVKEGKVTGTPVEYLFK